uniref:Uncharacterized protein n=1 Tax=Anopheles quadriannulatus TaxID=34691 RepID=A0A182X437_ANOQN
MKNLVNLNLSYNKIQTITADSEGVCCEMLECLNLIGNSLKQFDFAVVMYMPQFQRIFLGNNQIATISLEPNQPYTAKQRFCSWKSYYLKRIEVGVEIPKPPCVDYFAKLNRIALNHNKLTTVDMSLFERMNMLDDLDLAGTSGTQPARAVTGPLQYPATVRFLKESLGRQLVQRLAEPFRWWRCRPVEVGRQSTLLGVTVRDVQDGNEAEVAGRLVWLLASLLVLLIGWAVAWCLRHVRRCVRIGHKELSPPEDDGGREGGIDGGGDEEEEDDEPGGELVSIGFVGGYTPIAVPGDPGIGVLGEDSTGGCSVLCHSADRRVICHDSCANRRGATYVDTTDRNVPGMIKGAIYQTCFDANGHTDRACHGDLLAVDRILATVCHLHTFPGHRHVGHVRMIDGHAEPGGRCVHSGTCLHARGRPNGTTDRAHHVVVRAGVRGACRAANAGRRHTRA